jgi:hypothetical protein
VHGAKRPPHGCRTVLPINATTQSPPAKRGAGPGHRHLWTADNMGGTASLPGYHDVPHKRGPLNRSPEGCLSGSYRPPPRPTDGSVILSGMANVPHAARGGTHIVPCPGHEHQARLSPMALALTLALPGCMDTKPVRCGAEENSEFFWEAGPMPWDVPYGQEWRPYSSGY